MGAAKRAQVRATENFLANLDQIGEFLLELSPEAAPRVHRQLRQQIDELLTLLEVHPGLGRPARLLQTRSIQARERAARAERTARSLGAAELREYILRDHVVLYAHSDTAVFLLAIKHNRQLEYQL